MILQSMYSIFGKIRSFRKMYMLFSCLRAKQIKAAFWVIAFISMQTAMSMSRKGHSLFPESAERCIIPELSGEHTGCKTTDRVQKGCNKKTGRRRKIKGVLLYEK